jgi:hypothetical protein
MARLIVAAVGRGMACVAAACVVALTASPAQAQVAGISIDAEGVVRAEYSRRESSSVAAKRMQAFADDHLPGKLTPFKELRKVSLRGLAAAMDAAGTPDKLPDEARYLYGLQRLDYVFVDEENRDIVLAGPAEGFAPDASGRMVGLTTGRPVMHLEDLLAALRWEATGGRREQIGCSIDPEPQRLQNLQDWLRMNSTPASRSVATSRYPVMAQILGPQKISVFGVPPDSHFARVLVEADYRMKLIALGKEQPGVLGLRSQLSLLTPNGNSLQRWWFVPLYNPIEVDNEGLAFHLSGQRAQLLAQDEWSDGAGRRGDASFTRRSTEKFAQLFTEHFEDLAAKSPAFAELQNVFDLAVFGALLEREGWVQRFDLPMGRLLNESSWPLTKHPIPATVDSQATTTNRGNLVLGLVGGVTLVPSQVLDQPLQRETNNSLRDVRQAALPASKEPRSAWWDE